jgi:hypothetical protein
MIALMNLKKGDYCMKNPLKLLALMAIAFIVITCTQKKIESAKAIETPTETNTASVITFSSSKDVNEMQAKLGREFKDSEIAEYSKMINASIKADRITASSYLASNSKTLTYVPENIHNLNFQNAWVEGVEGDGIGEYITFHFNDLRIPPEIYTIVIANGYVLSEKTFRENNRVEKLKVYIDDSLFAVLLLEDFRGEQIFRFDPPIGRGKTNSWTLKFEILEVFKGDKYEDTAITEIYFEQLPIAVADSGAFDGVITVQVENGNTLNSIISELRVSYDFWVQTDVSFSLTGAYSNGGFTVTLPKTLDAKYLSEFSYFSKNNANHFVFTHIEGYDSNGSIVAKFKLRGEDLKQGDYGLYGTIYTVNFWYVDRDTPVDFSEKGYTLNINLKKGWNKIYAASDYESGNVSHTTVPPDCNVKWQFERL